MSIGACDGNMEQGSFRCDANVSIRPRGQTALGTRCELKNINSFRFVEQAIEVEILRHARVLDDGGAIEQETRLYDSAKKATRAMRSKEEAHDYRYFPDPDLPPLSIDPGWIDRVRASLPELPAAKIARWRALGVPEEHARVFAEEPAVARFFDAAVAGREALAVAVAHFVKGELLRELKDAPEALDGAKLAPAALGELVALKEADKISSSQQKKLFLAMWSEGTPLERLMAEEGEQVDDAAALIPLVEAAIAGNPKQVEQYRAGKTNLLSFFIGQVMKATQGKAKPPLIRDLIIERLGGE